MVTGVLVVLGGLVVTGELEAIGELEEKGVGVGVSLVRELSIVFADGNLTTKKAATKTTITIMDAATASNFLCDTLLVVNLISNSYLGRQII